jgi:hypothetical protein
LKLSVFGHWIFELLTKKVPLHQDVDAWRKHTRAGLALIQRNRLRVLLAAKDQLHFLLALRLMTPHGKGGGHQHRHDSQTDQQRRHRVAALAALTL